MTRPVRKCRTQRLRRCDGLHKVGDPDEPTRFVRCPSLEAEPRPSVPRKKRRSLALCDSCFSNLNRTNK